MINIMQAIENDDYFQNSMDSFFFCRSWRKKNKWNEQRAQIFIGSLILGGFRNGLIVKRPKWTEKEERSINL